MVASSSAAFSAVVLAAAAASLQQVQSFVMPPSISTPTTAGSLPRAATAISPFAISQSASTASRSNLGTTLYMSTSPTQSTLTLQLEKPLGLILEESGDDVGGVVVTQVNEGGSAFDSPSKEQLIQSKINSVMGQDVSTLSFDDVMDVIIGAPSPLEIEFSVVSSAAVADESEAAEEAEAAPAIPTYDVGAIVSITVQQPETNKPDIILEAKVGDNLRKTLLANSDIEVYRGLKKKLGNCGGGGQCGFCAMELIDEEGVWGERSDYEAQKIGKNGNEKCRLACMNNIVGPATVRTL